MKDEDDFEAYCKQFQEYLSAWIRCSLTPDETPKDLELEKLSRFQYGLLVLWNAMKAYLLTILGIIAFCLYVWIRWNQPFLR